MCPNHFFFFFKHSKPSGFSETGEFRVKTIYFPLLFPCRPMTGLTPAVNDKLRFNKVDASVRAISTSVDRASIYTKNDHFHPKSILYLCCDVLSFLVQFDLGTIYNTL